MDLNDIPQQAKSFLEQKREKEFSSELHIYRLFELGMDIRISGLHHIRCPAVTSSIRSGRYPAQGISRAA